MNVTTVKLHKSTKYALDELKQAGETYDDVIERIISQVRHKDLKTELVEGYKRAAKEQIKILSEWEVASSELDK